MQTRYLYLLKYILAITDVIMLNLVYYLAYFFTNYLGKDVSFELLQHQIIICNLIWLFTASIFGLYTEYTSRRIERIYRATWKCTLSHFLLFSLFLLFENDQDFSRTLIFSFYMLLGLFFAFNRFIGTGIQFLLINKYNATKKVAVMGFNPTGNRLGEYLQKQRNIEFYGFIAHHNQFYEENGALSDQVVSEMQLAAANGVNDLYVAIAPERMNKIHRLVQVAEKECLRLKFIPDIAGSLAAPYTITYMGGEFPIITLRHEPLEKLGNRFKKRVFDLIFSTLVIAFLLSWLYPILAILIRLESKGPVLFKQQRSGRNDNPFCCYKFRSMTVNTASDAEQATKNDSRITRIGAFLRRTSLDELPQFFNVFKGEMSVVGPRPHMLKHTEEYRAIISQFMVRQFLKPGITGWAQVNGYRGETKEDGAMENRVKYDIWYLENWTGALDVKIIFMTVFNIIKGEENAY
jgi:putative colanic acid biosynthesis UDP-glucose lipid carrier transferase